MKTYKRILSVLLCVVLTLTAAPLSGFVGLDLPNLFGFRAEAVTYSGYCGSNVIWVLDTSTGLLEINGTGAMTNYDSAANVPWNSYRKSVKTVKIGNNVTTIGDRAFADFPNLSDLTIGNSVKTIGKTAFGSCSNLTSIKIPDSVNYIDKWAFYYCIDLTDVTIGKGVKTIGESAFDGCKRLVNLTIGNSVTTIGENAFCMCFNLKSVTIPNGVTSIGGGAFSDCYRLISVTIPDSVKTIGDYAFFSCDSLSTVYYTGTKEQWNKITINSYTNEQLTNCTIHYNVHFHSYSSIITTSATCSQNGTITYICNCGDSYTETIPNKSHTPSDWEIISNATCTENGSKVKRCISCNIILQTETINSMGHNAGNWEIELNVTCTEDGKNVKKCITCNEIVEIEIINANGHTSGAWETTIVATTESEGKKIKKCTVCGRTLEEEIIPQLPKEAVKDDTVVILPSTSTISYGDSIILHVDTSKIPEGGYVEWTATNGNFATSVSEDGSTCKITSSSSGDTTFTAVVYDEDGRPIFTDEQVMTSKAGFFQKLISFFKNLFGISRIILQSFDY